MSATSDAILAKHPLLPRIRRLKDTVENLEDARNAARIYASQQNEVDRADEYRNMQAAEDELWADILNRDATLKEAVNYALEVLEMDEYRALGPATLNAHKMLYKASRLLAEKTL